MSRKGRKAAPTMSAAKLKFWGALRTPLRDTRPLLQGALLQRAMVKKLLRNP